MAATLLLALAPVRAQQAVPLPCTKGDRACAAKAVEAHSVRKAAYWSAALAKPVGERLGPAPPDLVEYLNLDNILAGFPNEPRASVLAPDFVSDAREAIADLPPAVRRLFDGTFAGVYFVEDLGGTGYTDMYFESKGRPAGGFIVLDSAVLGKLTANAWATWKENTPFRAHSAWKLEASIETSANDNRRNAIQYILLHELGHVLSINRNIHPQWDIPPKTVPVGTRFPFFELAWWIDRSEDRYGSKFEAQFPLRRSVVYYLGAKLAATDMVTAYGSLEKTNYPTLYAATGAGDDFAESFASYVHTVLMKRPWEIRIIHDGKVAKLIASCWEEARCAAKRKILEDLLR
jgi:hypothetical protein